MGCGGGSYFSVGRREDLQLGLQRVGQLLIDGGLVVRVEHPPAEVHRVLGPIDGLCVCVCV